MTTRLLRLVLDQNFPQSLLRDLDEWLPTGMVISHLGQVDARLRDVSDRELLIALHQLGYHGLITTNHKMLSVAEEVAAIIATKATVIATKSMGHDPIRAAGALLLELPGLVGRLSPQRANVFLLNYAHRQPEDAWDYLQRIAARLNTTASELHRLVGVTEDELGTPVLPQSQQPGTAR